MGCNGSKKEDANKDRKFKADAAAAKSGGDQKVLKPRADPNTPQKDGAAGGAGAGAGGGPVTPGAATAAGGDDVYRSPAKGIATPNSSKPNTGASQKEDPVEAAANKIYSTSYTNKRTKEYDLLHRIVEQTQNNFIDVQNNKQQSLDEDAEDRGRALNKYKQLGEISMGPGGIIALSANPNASANASGIAAAAAAPAAPSTAAIAPALPAASVKESDVVAVLSGAQISSADATLMSQSLDAITAALATSLAVQPVGPIVLTFEELQKTDFVAAV